MSSVIRPSGPLPPHVYWRRRLLVLAILVVAVSVLWWVVSGIGDAQEPAAAPNGSTTSTAVPETTSPASSSTEATDGWLQTQSEPTRRSKPEEESKPPRETKSVDYGGEDGPSADPRQPRQPSSTDPAEPSKTAAPTTETPSSVCEPTQLDLHIDVDDAMAGQPMTATFSFTSRDGFACALSVTPETLVARVTSGDDVVWSSNDCPNALLARQVVVPTEGTGIYTFSWDGRRSTDGCATRGSVPDPGGYWVEAALVGGQAHKSFFDLTE